MEHRWHFFRAGGVDQVSLRDGKDRVAIARLDQKLWVALAMPTKGVDLDPATLDLIDTDKDGRIRVHDIQREVEFIAATFKDPDDVLQSADEIDLTDLKDDKVVAAAKRMLTDLGKADARVITVADADAIQKAFADTKLNGDGSVAPAARLPLQVGLNPAWSERIAAFVDQVVKPLVGPRDVLAPADLETIQTKLAPFEAWRAAQPARPVGKLDDAWVEKLAQPELRAKLAKLIADDAALTGEYDQINAVIKAVRFQRDFGRLARNFII